MWRPAVPLALDAVEVFAAFDDRQGSHSAVGGRCPNGALVPKLLMQ